MDTSTIASLAWIILLAPGIASILITLFFQKNKALSGALSVGSMIIGALLSITWSRRGRGPRPSSATSRG